MRPLHRYMHDKLVRNLDMSDDQVADELAFARLLREKADYFSQTLSWRQSNHREILTQFDFKIMSLGYNCLPRTLSAKYGLIESRSQGRKSGPFDLSVHPMSAVARLLDTDFNDYENAELYYVGQDGIPRLKTPKVLFNHDLDEKLYEDAFAGLIEKNKRRASNFLKEARSEKALFVANIGRATPDNVNAVYKSIRRINSDAPVLFLQLEHHSENFDMKLSGAEIFTRPAPRKNYFWHLPKDFMTLEGMQFESDIIEKLVEFVKQNVSRLQ